MVEGRFPDGFFARIDTSPDAEFYASPRFVTHIDPATIAALTQSYAELLPPGAALLDLMSSWVSHLPAGPYQRVAGLGMNAEELAANPVLDDWCVHDLNHDPELPYPDASFDAVLCAVSIQYLVRPVEVFASMLRVLRPGGLALVATSHRLFPTKAIRAWQVLPPEDRLRVIGSYFEGAGGYGKPRFLDRSPADADPLWIVCASRGEQPEDPPTIR
jgi:SAM-dependent methyltransferase